MKNTVLAIIAFITGILISGVAAFFSIIGLTAIFAGAFWSIVIMGTALEVGKLVAVSWLYNSWKITPKLVKTYLLSAIAVLMLITSMGIFGFLSKSHIEQQVLLNTGVKEQIEILDFKISISENTIKDVDRQIEQINAAIEKLTERNQERTSIYVADTQRKNRDALLNKKKEELKVLSELKIEKVKLGSQYQRIEAEVGPIKYVAELIYGSSDTSVVDKSIRFVIILLIFVFDPLAVLLLIAFNISLDARMNYKNMEFYYVNNKDFSKRKTTKNKKANKEKAAQLPLENDDTEPANIRTVE